MLVLIKPSATLFQVYNTIGRVCFEYVTAKTWLTQFLFKPSGVLRAMLGKCNLNERWSFTSTNSIRLSKMHFM